MGDNLPFGPKQSAAPSVAVDRLRSSDEASIRIDRRRFCEPRGALPTT
jgi:hypothetical protein